MEYYILRVYRRDENDPQMVVGTLEFVGKDKKKNFTTFDQLKEILNGETEEPCKGRGPGRPAPRQ